MTEDELCDMLRENLEVRVTVGSGEDQDYGTVQITVRILFKNRIVCSDTDSLEY